MSGDTSIQSGSVNNGNIKNQSSEFYTTWLDNSGIYWDNMLNLHYFNQYVHTQMHSGKTTKGQYQQYSVSVASDVGHSLSLSPGMTATPYGKISFFHTRKTDDELDNQMIAALPPASGMDGEMGILVAADFICPANACAPILSPPYHMNLPGIVE
ncbi:autotransporter outer membrane beta-barrel domain-containing protein [Citrobacter sp. JGM124]|uniref:autotransporter outer membrane beta-barrel domain-containing protein n=1 Tax=Citrobacter sp. JGM124 TaxID=2799789 RepID=UPI001BAC045D|nr:autotransporter outer membrane beta-barrel domain-containing protein [Citrobacter sp. JGM124]MBS0848566.1 autotransporter outer membrane beta-barrel domain-containing protein [Citrobacter sp. JGM124]